MICGLALSLALALGRRASAQGRARAASPGTPPRRRRGAPPAGAPAADARTKVKVEKGAGGKKIYRITEEIRIEGKIQKPEAFFFYQKSSINYDWQELKQDFIPKILDSVSHAHRSSDLPEDHRPTLQRTKDPRMATQAAAAQQAADRLGRKAEDPPHRHHPGRADRRGAAGPQAREHHHRPVGEEHVRRARPTRCRATGCCSRSAATSTSRTSPTAWTPASPSATRSSRSPQLKQTGKIQKRGASWVLPLDERSRGKITLGGHDDPVPVRHAAAAAAAAAAAGVGARLGAVGPRLVLHDHRRGVVPAPPRPRHLPAQRRLAAQARHRGDPRSLRADGGEEAGREEAGGEEGRRGQEGRREEGREEEGRRGEEGRSKQELTAEEKAKLGRGEGHGRTPSAARASPSR